MPTSCLLDAEGGALIGTCVRLPSAEFRGVVWGDGSAMEAWLVTDTLMMGRREASLRLPFTSGPWVQFEPEAPPRLERDEPVSLRALDGSIALDAPAYPAAYFRDARGDELVLVMNPAEGRRQRGVVGLFKVGP